MKLIPYYKEDQGAKFSGSISLENNIDVLSKEDAIIISDYMNSCIVIDEWLSNVKDILTNKLEISSKTWSDGTYIWDSSHIHYVKRYKARLPINFISHVKKQIKGGFNPKNLDANNLSDHFNEILIKVSEGDESYYDGEY